MPLKFLSKLVACVAVLVIVFGLVSTHYLVAGEYADSEHEEVDDHGYRELSEEDAKKKEYVKYEHKEKKMDEGVESKEEAEAEVTAGSFDGKCLQMRENVGPGSSPYQVKNLSKMLKGLGYLDGDASEYDFGLILAVLKYQLSRKLPITLLIDDDTRKSINTTYAAKYCGGEFSGASDDGYGYEDNESSEYTVSGNSVEDSDLGVVDSCVIDMRKGVNGCKDRPAISMINKNMGEPVLSIDMSKLSCDMYVGFDVYFSDSGNDKWMVNIGNSITNDGWGGDYRTQSRDSEVQLVSKSLLSSTPDKGRIYYYRSDHGLKAGREHMAYVSKVLHLNRGDSVAQFVIGNEFVASRFGDEEYKIAKGGDFFALCGQDDTQGEINSEFFASFNRVIDGGSHPGRVGSGVRKVKIWFSKNPPTGKVVDTSGELSLKASPASVSGTKAFGVIVDDFSRLENNNGHKVYIPFISGERH